MTSVFLVLWFDCCASDKRVLGFMVSLWRKSQARSWFYGLIACKSQACSWFYGLIVAEVTSAFLVLWFDCGASDKRVFFMV